MTVYDDDQFRQIFATRLRHIMYDQGMSQAELAKKSNLSQTCISRYLNGSRTPSGYCIMKIADALRCSVSDLTGTCAGI